MSGNRRNPIILLALAVVVIIGGSLFLFPNRSSVGVEELESAISEYLDQDVFVTFEPSTQSGFGAGVTRQYYSNALTLLQRKYKRTDINAIGINEPISDERINIYFFDDDPIGLLKPFQSNCTYTGHRQIIVCDMGHIKRTLLLGNDFAKGSGTMPGFSAQEVEQLLNTIVDHVYLWVIGHEIGHIAHGHSGREFNFDGKRWGIFNRTRFASGDSREVEADDFAVEAVGNQGVGFFLWLGLSQIVANPKMFSLPSSDDQAILLSDCSLTHEPLFKRAVDIAQKTIDSGLVIDSTGHFERIAERIKLNTENCS